MWKSVASICASSLTNRTLIVIFNLTKIQSTNISTPPPLAHKRRRNVHPRFIVQSNFLGEKAICGEIRKESGDSALTLCFVACQCGSKPMNRLVSGRLTLFFELPAVRWTEVMMVEEVWSIWVYDVLARPLFVYCPLRNWNGCCCN